MVSRSIPCKNKYYTICNAPGSGGHNRLREQSIPSDPGTLYQDVNTYPAEVQAHGGTYTQGIFRRGGLVMPVTKLIAAALAVTVSIIVRARASGGRGRAHRQDRGLGSEVRAAPLVRRQFRGRAQRGDKGHQRRGRREAWRRRQGEDGVHVLRLRLQCRPGHLDCAQGRIANRSVDRHRSDVFRRRGGHVRHLPEKGGRQVRHRAPVPHSHRHRDSPRTRQEVPVDVPQRAQRDHHV